MESQELQDGTYTVLVSERKTSGLRGQRHADSGEVVWHEFVKRHGGVEVGAIAGGSAAAFRSAVEAVRCAVAIQEAQDSASQWALGVQAGELHAAAGVEAGPVVLATRLAVLAREGQVLASALVRELVAEDPDVRMARRARSACRDSPAG